MPKAYKTQEPVWATKTIPRVGRYAALVIGGFRPLDIIETLALHLAISPNKFQQQIAQGMYNDNSFE